MGTENKPSPQTRLTHAELEAIRDLQAQGAMPTKTAVASWLENHKAALDSAGNTAHKSQNTTEPITPPIDSHSRLEPRLRDTGTLGRPHPRKPGRPRIIASWFPAVAETMADGTSLKTALAIHGIRGLSKSEIRALYRNTAFQALYKEARRRYYMEHYGHKPSLRAKLGRYV